jgi:hypothetical protein
VKTKGIAEEHVETWEGKLLLASLLPPGNDAKV